ncbi:SDR family oxidoreductase [bacterium]|nr:SDR family oxidoreductase [bacterium]
MNNQFSDLKGKWALVLGASSGFGAAVAKSLSEAGVNIYGVHLDRKSTMPEVEKTITAIEANGAQAVFNNMNASDAQKRQEAIAQLKEVSDGQGAHIVLHSLAFGALKPFIDESALTESQMNMTMDVMANSLVYWVQDLVKAEQLAKGGRIFAMTSAGSERVWKSYGAVSAAKSALESHIRQLSLELAPMKVTANAIMAGVTDTPALRKIPGNAEMIELASQKNPYKRLTTPQDIADTVLALSLPHTHWLTGNVLGVDGGERIVE